MVITINLYQPQQISTNFYKSLCNLRFNLYQSLSISTIFAQSKTLETTPVILDFKTKAEDSVRGDILLKNIEERKRTLYATVENVNSEKGNEEFLDPSKADQTTSLANWIEITRGVVELLPREEKAIPINIEVNMRAKAGKYHAEISWREGSTRSEAEAKPVIGKTLVNFEVEEEIKEELNVKSFMPAQRVFWKYPIIFTYELENKGNRPLKPEGRILIYKQNGKELAVLNMEGAEEIKQGETKKISRVWEYGKGAGNLKAILDVQYGKPAKRVQDTIFFWLFPWQTLLIFIGVSVGLVGGVKMIKKTGNEKGGNEETEKEKIYDIYHPKK